MALAGKQILVVTLIIACLSRFQGGSLPSDLSSLMSLRKVIDFQFIQISPVLKDRNDDFQAFHINPEVLKY